MQAVQKRHNNVGFRRITGYDVANGVDIDNLRVDPTAFDKITERENKSFIILKNQIDNYTINVDDLFGIRPLLGKIFVKKKKPEWQAPPPGNDK